ncbi:MAG: MmgE/PrpD family protein [Desulfobacteraceae bacterium]|nr:MmgE/PrpD family protein [Desulfobacteraceae bacterium]
MESQKGATIILSDFVSRLKLDQVPGTVVEKARMCMLDYLGAVYAGVQTREAALARGFADKIGGNPQATMAGARGGKTSAPVAAMVNAVACHSLELDDAHRYATGLHPGATVIPAAMALGEHLSCSAENIWLAVIAGYEVAGRVGRAINPSHRYRGFHSTGTVASLGAAAAGAKVLGLDTKKTAWAIGISGSLAGGIFEFLREGSMNKLLHAGNAASNGITAAFMANDGFTGPTTVIEGEEGFCRAFSDEYDISKITSDIGGQYEIDATYFKPHASCGQSFGAIDAVLELRPEVEPVIKDIKKVTIQTFRAAAVLNQQEPRTIREAKFSIPFVAALALRKGGASYSDFNSDTLKDPDINELARKVEVVEEKDITENFPAKRTAIVTVELNDGKVITRQVDFPRGMPENPLTKEELRSKFVSLSRGPIGPDKAIQVADSVLDPDFQGNLYSFMALV